MEASSIDKGEWTHEKLQGLLQIDNEDRYVADHAFENTLDEINAALAAVREASTANAAINAMTGNRYKYHDSKGEHVHTLDGQPLVGTSRVGNVIAKPLAWYGSGQAVKVFGCPEPKVLTKIKNKKATKEERDRHYDSLLQFFDRMKSPSFSINDYCVLIDQAYRAHDTYMRQRAKGGTNIHAECEKFIKDRMRDGDTMETMHEYPEQIWPFIEWSDHNVKRYLWSEGHCYSEKHWLGGISDAGYKKHDDRFGILDFKSSKEAYLSQFWQCAGYDIQIAENGVMDADGNLLSLPPPRIDEYCIFAFGGDKPKPYFFEDVKGAREAFLACLLIYRKLPQE